MIIAVIGGIGSGKSVYATKKVIESPHHCFVNFNIRTNNSTRIRKDMIVETLTTGTTKTGKPIQEKAVNFDFWNKQLKTYGNFNIFLDEVHNLIHSRQAMTKWNTLASIWISQIRKILGDKEETAIYLISQRLKRIDIAFRDLLHHLIYCEKVPTGHFAKTNIMHKGAVTTKLLPLIMIRQLHFIGTYCTDKYEAYKYGAKSYDFKTQFYANPYFQYYDSYEQFGDTPYV